MRKKINALFVVLAMASVTYGMVVRYSVQQAPVSTADDTITPVEVSLSQDDDFKDLEEDVVNLDIIAAEPD